MMHDQCGWMTGSMGGGMWIWMGVGILIIVLLAVLIAKNSKK